jgi:methylglutaconyl-CoA hydratase
MMNGPGAVAETKRILFETSGLYIDDELAGKLAEGHSRQRQTDEASEGLQSFAEKRNASWYAD